MKTFDPARIAARRKKLRKTQHDLVDDFINTLTYNKA